MAMAEAELQARIDELERRLARVEAAEAIRRLKARYGELADRRYAGGAVVAPAQLAELAHELSLLFTEDAVWDGGEALGLCRGREAIRKRFEEPTLSFAWHLFVKPQIEVTGERARATWDVLAPCTTREGRACWMAGVEHDEYERVGDAWLHSSMRLDVVFMAPHDKGWAKRRRAE